MSRKIVAVCAVTMCFVALLANQTPGAAQPTSTDSWPIGSGDLADPHITRGVDRWWVYGTNSGGHLVPTRSSTDLLNWRTEADALARVAAWGSGEIWAPAVASIDNRWVMYFTDKNNNPSSPHRCIGVAISSSPSGPFEPLRLPLACDRTRGGHIDASLFRDANGNNWLLYKNDDPSRNGLPVIRSRPLQADGLAFAGPETALVAADAPWEAGVNENPSMVTGPDGRLHLFWSGNNWRTSSYSMGHAICSSPSGPCVEDPNPWLNGLPGGSGGGSFSPILKGTKSDIALLTIHRWQRAEGYDNGGHRSAELLTVAFNQSLPRTVNASVGRLGPFAETCGGWLSTIVGTPNDDRIRGTRGNDVITAGAGDDRVTASAGNDIVCGGSGDDWLNGGSGNDAIQGDAGNDTLKGNTGRDGLSGGPGNDLLIGGKHRDRLVGGSGNDRLRGGLGNDLCSAEGSTSSKKC